MAVIKITVHGFRCERCGHEWIARVARNAKPGDTPQPPRICPKCKSAWWDTPKRTK